MSDKIKEVFGLLLLCINDSTNNSIPVKGTGVFTLVWRVRL